MLQERHFQAVFRNKALPQTSVADEVQSFYLSPRKPCRNLSTDSPRPPWPAAQALCKVILFVSLARVPHQGQARLHWGDLPRACSACLPAHTLGFSAHRNQSAKGGFKAAVQPGVHIPESAITPRISHALTSPSTAHLKPALTVLPLYQTWFPKHLIQTIAPQAVWKPKRITNFLGQEQW